MKATHLFFLALSLTALHTAAAVAPAPTDPKSVVQSIIDRARVLDRKQTYAQNTKAIEALVDFERITRDALGENLSVASASDRREVRDLLRRILTRTVYPGAPKFFGRVTVEFQDQVQEGSRMKVSSVVNQVHDGKRSSVEYWLERQDDGYRVVDVAVEGERWVENVQAQFDEIIRKKGVKDLISRMKKRAKELENRG